MHSHRHTHTYTQICTYSHTHTHKHAHTHTHTHTLAHAKKHVNSQSHTHDVNVQRLHSKYISKYLKHSGEKRKSYLRRYAVSLPHLTRPSSPRKKQKVTRAQLHTNINTNGNFSLLALQRANKKHCECTTNFAYGFPSDRQKFTRYMKRTVNTHTMGLQYRKVYIGHKKDCTHNNNLNYGFTTQTGKSNI